MLMLGMRREAHRTLTFLLDSQTGPGALSEWNVRTDRAHRLYGRWCRGTGPTHLWSAALYVTQMRTMFLCEEGDRRLALLPGVPAEWLGDGRTVAIENAPTHFGLVSVRCTSRIKDGRVAIDILPESDPPEGYTLFLPFERPAARILVSGMAPQPGGRLDRGVRLPIGSRRVVVVLEP